MTEVSVFRTSDHSSIHFKIEMEKDRTGLQVKGLDWAR